MKATCLQHPTASPGPSLYRHVRAELMARGLTFGQWCQEQGVGRQHAYQCLTGRRGGHAASDLLHRLVSAVREP
jgi:hypothetical protein